MAVRRVQRSVGPGQVPLMGMAAAFVFAAQMINFPVAGGTSGHLLGGLLASLLLGPAPAVVGDRRGRSGDPAVLHLDHDRRPAGQGRASAGRH